MRGSISTTVVFFATSRMRTVKLPVPGPTSSTMSVDLRLALSTMLRERAQAQSASILPLLSLSHTTHPCATSGFLRICCPKRSVLKMGFFVALDPTPLPDEPLPDADDCPGRTLPADGAAYGAEARLRSLSDTARGMLVVLLEGCEGCEASREGSRVERRQNFVHWARYRPGQAQAFACCCAHQLGSRSKQRFRTSSNTRGERSDVQEEMSLRSVGGREALPRSAVTNRRHWSLAARAGSSREASHLREDNMRRWAGSAQVIQPNYKGTSQVRRSACGGQRLSVEVSHELLKRVGRLGLLPLFART